MSKFCKKCGRKLSDEAKFCTQCGQPCSKEGDAHVEEKFQEKNGRISRREGRYPEIKFREKSKDRRTATRNKPRTGIRPKTRQKIPKVENPINYRCLHFMCGMCRIFRDLSASDSAYRTAEK